MTSRAEVLLTEVPSLGSLYAGAIGKLARAAVVRPSLGPPTLPAVTYRADGVAVDAANLADYQRLLGEPGTDALPAGYVHVASFGVAMAIMTRDDFPLPLLGMVHLANRVEQLRPLHANDSLSITAWAEGLREHRLGTQVDLVVEVRAAGDTAGDPAPAWRGVSTYLAKGRRLRGLPRSATDQAADGGASPRGHVAFESGSVPAVTATWKLPADAGRRYAAVSGDRNPIHLWPLLAKAFGFPRAIAHGMDTAARALAAVGPLRGDAFTWDVTFAKPVLLPGTVAVNLTREPDGALSYAGWNPQSAKLHFSGSVTPLR